MYNAILWYSDIEHYELYGIWGCKLAAAERMIDYSPLTVTVVHVQGLL